MYDINSEGTIYFGTKVENINTLNDKGLNKPFTRNEKFISVSVSGYKGELPVSCHDELSFLSDIFANKYHAAKINNDKYLKWNIGYKNSITYIDGFGPNENKTYNEFGNEKENNRVGQNITAIIDKKFSKELVNFFNIDNAEKEFPFEYLSISLHPFIKRIKPEMIIGWIVDKSNINEIKKKMDSGIITKNNLYLIEEMS